MRNLASVMDELKTSYIAILLLLSLSSEKLLHEYVPCTYLYLTRPSYVAMLQVMPSNTYL